MYVIVLRRTNGRFVKRLERPFRSKYAAKQRVPHWEAKYDEATYYIVIEKLEPRFNI
jgi:hypothetical protein